MRNDVLPSFAAFIADLKAIWANETDTQRRMERGRDALETFVRDPALQELSRAWPSTEGHKNLSPSRSPILTPMRTTLSCGSNFRAQTSRQ